MPWNRAMLGRKVGLEPTTHEGDEPSCSDQLSYLRCLINNLTNLKTWVKNDYIYHLWRLGVANSKKPLLHRTDFRPPNSINNNYNKQFNNLKFNISYWGSISIYPMALLAHFLEVGADFQCGNNECDNCCHKHYICYHKFICLMGYTIGCCLWFYLFHALAAVLHHPVFQLALFEVE